MSLMAIDNWGTLLAGAAETDITPALGTQIAGDIGRKRPAKVALEPLYAKALVLEGDGVKACVISMDLLAALTGHCALIRSEIEKKHKIPKENVIVHVLQNHSAPSLGHLMIPPTDNHLLPKEEEWRFLYGGDEAYDQRCIARVLAAVDEAAAKMQPVHVGVSRAVDGRFSFNRRAVMRDGRRIGEVPKLDRDILYIEGPVDPEVGVALLVNDEMENIAVLLHHSSHPTSGFAGDYISSDWPGAWCDRMRGVLGRQCVPIVINGCCGNLVHDNKLDPDHVRSDYQRMGAGLAESTVKALKDLEYIPRPLLRMANTHLQIPLREFGEEYLKNARAIYERHPMPKWDEKTNTMDWDWWIATSALDTYHYWSQFKTFDYEIQALRIGELALVSLGGEPFVEGQLAIKLRSPAEYTFIAHMCNYYVGYVPIREAVENPGSWDTYMSQGSKLDAGALDMISGASVDLLNTLYP